MSFSLVLPTVIHVLTITLRSDFQSPIEITSRPSTMLIYYTRQVLTRSSSLFISSWASWTHRSATFHLSRQRQRTGSGSNSQWHVSFSRTFLWLIESVQCDEEENGGLRGLAEVLLNYGERHFEGTSDSKGARTGLWAAVLLSCGEFERVRGHMHASRPYQ